MFNGWVKSVRKEIKARAITWPHTVFSRHASILTMINTVYNHVKIHSYLHAVPTANQSAVLSTVRDTRIFWGPDKAEAFTLSLFWDPVDPLGVAYMHNFCDVFTNMLIK